MADKDDVVIPEFISFTKIWHNKSYDRISPLRPELSARGKNVVVTGGGTGIGKAVAIAFAQAGADSVFILGRRIDRLKTAAKEIMAAARTGNTRVLFETADLTKREDVDRALKSFVGKVGKISILVANAGALPEPGPLATMDAALFMKGFEVNVLTCLNAIQAFIPLAASNAVVFSISSGIGHIAPMPGMSSYAASKSAGTKMVDHFAAENPDLHFVNIQPGVVSTEINEGTSMLGQDEPALPGHFLVWLASSEAEFLKSKYVWVNWDVDELVSGAEEIKTSKLLTVLLEGVPM